MPQFDPSSFSSQLVWLAISFAVLYLLMARTALPRIAQVLEARQRRIDDNLAKAEELKAKAETAAAAYEEAAAAARAEAQDVLHGMNEETAALAARRQGELRTRLQADIRAAEARIAEERDQVIEGVRDIALEVTGAVVTRLLGEEADAKKVASAIEATMKEQG